MTKLRVTTVNASVASEELIAAIVACRRGLTEAEVKPFVDNLKTQKPPIHLASTSKAFIVKVAAALEQRGFTVEVRS